MTEQEVQSAKGAVQTLMVADTGLSLADLSTVFVKSGFFKDVREQSQAIVKVLVGQELGLKPLQSMMGIHIVEGKPELSAALLGVLVKRSGRYDYRVVEHTDTACELEFFWLDGGKRESLGTSRFTMDDAARAGLASRNVWKSYPRNMLHARALSNGVRWYAMDALGLPVYTEGEIDRPERDNGQQGVIDTTAEEVKEANPFASNKKEPVVAAGGTGAEGLDPAASHGSSEESAPAATAVEKEKPKRTRKSAAGEPPAGTRGPDPEPVAESTDPICVNVRLADGVRCSGPVGHDGECLYVVAGSEDCPTSGCWGGKGHEGEHVFDQTTSPAEAQESAEAGVEVAGEPGQAATATPDSPVQGADAPPPASGPTSVTFMIGNQVRTTAGMTEDDFRASLLLGSQLDKDPRYMNKAKWPKGYSRELLRRMLGLTDVEQASRTILTKAQGEQYLKIQREAVAAGAPQQAEIPK